MMFIENLFFSAKYTFQIKERNLTSLGIVIYYPNEIRTFSIFIGRDLSGSNVGACLRVPYARNGLSEL